MKKGFMTIPVTLLCVLAMVLCLTIAPAMADDWQQWRKDEVNSGRSSAEAITGSGGPEFMWEVSGFGTPIAVDGFIYYTLGGSLYKRAYDNSSVQTLTYPESFRGIPAYGNGTGRIFLYRSGGGNYILTGVNVSDFSDVKNLTISASLGKIKYFINKSGTKSIYSLLSSNVKCYDVGGTNLVYRWNYTQGGSVYSDWNAPVVIPGSTSASSDWVVFGNDSAGVTCLRESDGTYSDSIDIGAGQNQPHIRSSISWNATNDTYGHIFFTNCQGGTPGVENGYVWKIGLNTTTGHFNHGDVTNSTAIDRPTTTPVIHKGRVYTGGYRWFGPGTMYCFNESNLTHKIWENTNAGAIQVSAALAERNDTIYLYVTRNAPAPDHGLVCINDTGSSGEIEWVNTSVGPYVWCDNPIIAENATGTWIFASRVGLWSPRGQTPQVKPDLTVTAIVNETIYNGTYNIITATVENVGNGSAGTFNVSLKADNDFVENKTFTTLGIGASTEVKFLWTPTAGSYTLNVTADIDNTVTEWNETNNSKTKGVDTTPIPTTDLIVSEVCDGNLTSETDNVVFAVIRNDGADASGFSVSLEVGGAEIDKEFVPMLYFRDSQLVALNWTPTSEGNVRLNVTVDCNAQIAESNELNNMTSQNVAVVPRVTRTVSAGGSIQNNITNAANDTIIFVEPGTYNETVTIPASKSGIKLIANGSNVVICNNTGDIVTVDGANSYVKGFEINDSWNGTFYLNWPGAGINVTSAWNVIEDNYIYNTSGGIKLYGSKNLVKCNTVGNSSAGQACLNLMAISGDCNAIVKNKFDGDTSYGWVLGGTYTADGITETEAKNNLVRDNNFTVMGVGVWNPGNLYFGGDPNLVFNNIINDTVADKVTLGRLNWYFVDKVAVENPKCGNVVHGPFYGGNFWSAYTGNDTDQDLLGDEDIPYRVYDWNPLIKAICGDVDCNCEIKFLDVRKLNRHQSDPSYPICSKWAGDVDCEDGIKFLDVRKLNRHQSNPSYELKCCKCDCLD